MTQYAPWVTAKSMVHETDDTKKEAMSAQLRHDIYMMAERLRHIGILLQPFMPDKASKMLDVLGVAEENRTFAFIGFGADKSYGTPKVDVGKSAHDSLFPPLEVEETPPKRTAKGKGKNS